MIKRLIIVVSIVIISLFSINLISIKRAEPVKPITTYKIVSTNVIDVINKTIKYNHDVIIKNGIIAEISPHNEFSLTTIGNVITQTIIDGKGKYLIPGLWDNHSTLLKTSPEVDFPLYIANGITSIRSNLSCPNENKVSIYACMKDKKQWKQLITSGEMIGPNIHGWGTFPITGTQKNHPDLPSFHNANSIEEAKQVVEHYASYPEEEKPFFLKTYNWIKSAQFQELSKQAKLHGFELSGHMQRSLGLKEVIDAGQRSFAHARLFMFDCSFLSAELKTGKYSKTPLPILYPMLIEAFDENGCKHKYQYLIDNNVFLNPTLLTRRNDYYAVAGKVNEIKGLEYVHYLFMMEFEEDSVKLGKTLSNTEINAFKDFYHFSAKTIAFAQKYGVKVLAGSDSWNEYIVPGFSLHEELQALSQAGLDKYSILQAATINGAEYFRVSDNVGSIDIGKKANMVLLNKNPIDNIQYTQEIDTVFKGEQIYSQEKINTLKLDVKKLSNSHFFTFKLLMLLVQNPTGF